MAKKNQVSKAGQPGKQAGAAAPPNQDGAAAPSAPNTSAPEKTGNRADVSAPEAGQPAPGATTDPASNVDTATGDTQSPPAGGITAVALLVTAKRDGFRRCGRAWSKEQTRVDINKLSAAEVGALLAEPMLDVVVEGEGE